MTDTEQQDATKKNPGSNAPTHIAYHVRDAKDGKGTWTRIGSAWSHKDGKGFNIQIDTVPLDGRITLRSADDKNKQ